MIAKTLMSRYDSAAGGAAAKWRALMVEIGSVVAQCGELPPNLLGRLNEVRSEWDSGNATEDLRSAVKRECWSFLEGKHGNSSSIVDREDRTIRAMLCLLESPGDREAAYDLAGWVEDMLGQYCDTDAT
jgi:hypothetical protein